MKTMQPILPLRTGHETPDPQPVIGEPRLMERSTAQRKAIHGVLEHASRPLSPPEIFNAARAVAPGLGMATVYRTLKRLLDEKTISQV